MKKIMICLFTLLWTVLPIHAQEAAALTGTITMDGSDTNDSFDIYQMLVYDQETNNYQCTDDFKAFLSSMNTDITTYRTFTDNSDDLKKILTQYAVYVKKNNAESYVSLQEDRSINEVPLGQYLILGTSNDGYIYQVMTASLTTDDKNITVTAKRSKTGITRTSDASSYNISETVSYTITSSIPAYPEDASQKAFTIKDALADGVSGYKDLKVEASASDTFDTSETLTSGTHYTIGYDDANTSFEMTFDHEKIKDHKWIRITYSSVMDSNAQITAGVQTTSTLKYSKDPYASEASDTELTSDNTIYTYAIEVTSTDTDTKKALSETEFELYTDEACTKKIRFEKSTSAYVYNGQAEGDNTGDKLITDTEGKILLSGLKEGTYYLKETKTADHYQLPTSVFTINIKDENQNGLIEIDNNDTTAGIYTLTVPNTLNTSLLPETGGTGTILFSLAGLVGMSIITLIFTYIRRHS